MRNDGTDRELVREARAADAPAIAALLSELGYPAEPGAVGRRLRVLLSRDDCHASFAEDGGTAAGFGAVHVYPAITSDEPGALIIALVVSERCRGRGIGRDIVAGLERFAQSRGCARIIVTTANHREGAHEFYARLGYDFTGRRFAKRFA